MTTPSATPTTTSTTIPIKKLERHPPLSLEQYSSMEKWCREAIDQNHDFLYDATLFDAALLQACQQCLTTSTTTSNTYSLLQSFVRNTHVWHVKYTTRKVKAQLASHHLVRYAQQGDSIWKIAKDNGYPPYLMGRAMLELLLAGGDSSSIGRKGLTEAMRDPTGKLGTISVIAQDYRASEQFDGPRFDSEADAQSTTAATTRLAREVMHVIAMDPMYGPKHDVVRHNIGLEYEALLEHVLTCMDIPFETEGQLRERGTSRTPDVLLSTPIAIKVAGGTEDDNWRVVCWIDSKAMFGDAHTHKDSVLPQAESYIHRFGPGMLLYWFGHAPMLPDANGDLAICGWNLPETVLLPTGEIATNPTY